VLGALHGPAELLPISSSGHTTAIPWLLGSDYAELDAELRKLLEVALHAGAALGLLIQTSPGLRPQLRRLERRHLLIIAAASTPAGAAGLLLERRIEARLGTPATIAAGLLAGSLAMALADRAPEEREAGEAGFTDALWLGLAQATALIPGVSRAGATLTAARGRHFGRPAAGRLSAEMAWPVIGGATLLKAWRLRYGLREHLAPLLAGGGASLLSTLLVARHRRSAGALLPYAVYRATLAAVILLRLRLKRSPHDQGHARSA
jgi:undecaprenyl-diphosphatase